MRSSTRLSKISFILFILIFLIFFLGIFSLNSSFYTAKADSVPGMYNVYQYDSISHKSFIEDLGYYSDYFYNNNVSYGSTNGYTAKIYYKFSPINHIYDEESETSSFSNISDYKIFQYDLSQGYITFLNQLFEDFYLVVYIETSYYSKHVIEESSESGAVVSHTYNKQYNAYFLLFYKLSISYQNNQYVISSQRVDVLQYDSTEIQILNVDTDTGLSVISTMIKNGYDVSTDLLSTSSFSVSVISLDVNILSGKTWNGQEISIDNMNTGTISINSSNITSNNLIAGIYDNISISNVNMTIKMSVLDTIDTHASNHTVGSGDNAETIFEYSPVATSTPSTTITLSDASYTKVSPELDFDRGDSNNGFVGKDNILDASFVLKTKITLTSTIGEKECLNLYNVDEQTKSLFPEIFNIDQGGYIVSDYVIYDGVTNFKDKIKVNSSENNVFSLYNSSNSNYSFLGNLGLISGATSISNTENSSYITTILSYLKFAYYKFDDNGELNNNLFISIEGETSGTYFNAAGYSDIISSDNYALKLVSAEMIDDNNVLNLDNEFYNKNYVTVNKNNIYINGVLINLSKTYVVNDDELSSISDEHSTIIVSVFNNGFCLKYDNQEYLSIDIEFKKDDQLSTQPKSYIPFNIKSRPLKINVRNEENVEVINDKDWYGITYTDEVSYTGKYTRYFPLAEYIDSVQVKNSVSLGSGDKSNLDIEKVEVYLKKKNPAIDEAPYLNMYDYQSSHKLIKDIPTVSYDGNYYVNKATCSELIIKNKSFFVDLDSWIFSNGIEDDYFGTDPEKEIWSFDGTCFEDVVFGNKSYFYLNINIASGSENDFFNKNYEMHFNFSNIQSEDILTPQNNTYNHDEFGYVKKLSYNDRYLYLMQVTDSLFLDYPDLIINLSNYSITKYYGEYFQAHEIKEFDTLSPQIIKGLNNDYESIKNRIETSEDNWYVIFCKSISDINVGIDSNPNNIDLNTSNNYVIIHLTVGVKNPYYSQYSGYKDFENNIYEPYSNGILYATNESIGNVYKIIPVPYYYKAGDVAISGPTADNPGNNVTNRNFIQDDKVIINEKVKVVIENDALGELIINPLQLSIVMDGNVQSSLPSILNDHIVYENGDNDQTVYFDKFYDGSQIVYDASGNLVSGNISFFIDDYTYVPSSNNVLSSYNNIFDYDKDVNSLAISYEFRYENFLANAIYKSSNVYTDLEKYNISVLINNISIGVSQTETMYKIRNSYITSNIKVLMPANNQVGNDLIPTYLYGNIYNKQINMYALDNPEKDVNEISDYTRIYGYDFIPVVRVATYDNHIFNVADNPTFLQYYQNKYETTLNVSERFYADFYYQTYFSNCPSFVFYGELQDALRTYNETYKVDNVFIYLGLEGEDTTNLGKDYTKDFIKYKSFNYEQNENSVYLNDFFDYTEAFENDDNLTKTIQPFLNDYDYEADPAYNILTMFNKLNYQEETTVNLDTNYFINWIVDLTNNIIISPTTNPGTYTLYIDDEYAIANYVLKKSDLKSSFEILIKKQVLKAGNQEFPDVNDTIKERTVLYEVYSGTSNYDKILKHEYADYEDCYITINHPQYDELFDMFNNGGYFDVKNSDPAVITLKEFREYYQIYNPSDPIEYISHTSSFSQDMLDFKLAGTYVIDILLPDTSHYTMDGPFVYTFTITQAELYIYPTVGIRTYMTTYDESKEISFNNTPVLIGNEGIEGHAQKINTNTGEFSNDGNEIVYVKENEYDDCSIVYMLYTGFVNSEDFSTYSSTYEFYLAPRLTLEHSYEKDANNHNIDYAGFYTSTDNQAFIGNYCRVMNYHVNFMTSVFYIKRQNLTLDIEQYQFTTYSGDNVSLDYVITNDNGDSLPDGLTSLNREAYAYYIVNDSPIVDDDIYYKNYKTQPISYGKAEYNKDSLSYFSGVISESHYYYRYYFIKPNGEKIYLINEGNNNFSYLDENEQKIYISDKIYFKVNNIKTDYITESYFYETPTEHLCIYLELSPSNNVNNDKTIQDIVYINGVKAGIIWNTYAEIDPNAGQQILNNFMNSNSKYVFFDINKLEIVLCDNDKEIYDPDSINFSIYPVLHSSYSPDSEYMISAGNFYVFGNDLSRFISSSWVSSSIIENYYISPMIISEFELSSNYLERFYLSLSDQGDFDKQSNLNPINSGLYVLLVEVTNENSNNIYFSTQTAQNSLFGETKTNVNDDKTYIICYLVLERTSNININVAMIDESGEGNQSNVIVENKEVELSKTYDAIRPEFSVTSLVINNFDIINNTDNTSLFDNLLVNYRAVLYPNFNNKNNNETINEYIIRTYEELLSTNRLYSSNDSELENISNDLKSLMTNSGDYYIVYCINYDDGDTYNYNVATYYYIVNVIINKRPLTVSLQNININPLTESYSWGSKIYGQSVYIDEVTNQFVYNFTGFVLNSDKNIDEKTSILVSNNKFEEFYNSFTIDYSNLIETSEYNGYLNDIICKYTPYGEYQVGVNEILLENDFLSSFNLTNYDLLYGNDITFEVKRKDLVLNDNVFISVEATYTAEKIVPNIIFKDIDGNDMTGDFMPNYTQFNNQGTVVSMSVGGVLININEYDNYLGLISNSTIINNPNNVENKNVGYYWFNVYISANPNLSYNGMAMFKWMFKINKADLYMSTYDISNEIEAQITKTITYNGNDIVYPRYEIIYKGFKEKDLLYLGSNPIPAKGVVSIYTINGDNNYNDYGGFIDYIELINPIYTFVDEQNNELVEKPINVGRYKIKFLFSDVYGIAKNYNIILEDDFYDNKAPILEITPRPIDIMYDANNNSYITKKYDYYDNVVQGTVTTNNYTIISIDGVLNSGLKTGDEVYLNVNYEMSKYARSTVLDEDGKDTVIDVTIYAYTDLLGRSANNYMLYVSATNYTQGMFRYLLKGDITVADAYVDFYDFEDNIVNSQIDTEYNAEAQPIKLSVYGVKKKDGSYEDLFIDIDYIVTYLGDTSGYDSSEAPIICDKYVVEVQIQNSNYSSRTQSIIYFINKASVDIYFNGDSVQYFGDIIGLTAEANGKGNYVKNLQVTYYTYNDDTRGIEVKNIGLVGIGKYLVEAIHEETANFKYEVKFEILEIKYKDMYLNYDLSNKYTYSGMNQSFDIYYLYNDVKISPTLIVQKYINGEYKDYNTGTVFRLDVGKYRIKSVDLYSNFRLIGNNWIEFTVEKAKLSIFPKNTTIVENDDLLITPEIIGLLGSDTLSSAITNYNYLNVDFFDASTGEKLLDKPNSPGVYRMCYNNAESNNYYIQYQYGLLTINRSSINSDNLNDTDIILEGSFDKETEIVISKQNDSELNTFVQAFQSFKNSIDVNDEETDELLLTVKNYYLSEIYYINYINYTQSENDKITRIVIGFENGKVKKLSNKVIGAEENEIKYYVAYLDANGTITVTEAIYSESTLSFDIDDNKKIVAFSVLSEVNNLEDNTEINNISWILYLSVGLALILILISVVIFIKKG